MNKDYYSIYDTSLSFINNTECNGPDWHKQHFHHYALLHRVFNMLRNEGFEIEKDKNVPKIIRKTRTWNPSVYSIRGRHYYLVAG